MPQKKLKSSTFCSNKPLAIQYKQRHRSMVVSLNEDSVKDILQVIGDIIVKAEKQTEDKDRYVRQVTWFMGQIDSLGDRYTNVPEPSVEQIVNVCEDEPLAEGMKRITVVEPGNLKDMVKVPALPILQSPEQVKALRQSVQKEQNHRRQSIVNKLKKQYKNTLSTTYLSKSMPIEESRIYFKEMDPPDIEYLRQVSNKKEILGKKSSKNVKYWHDEPVRKENRMPTMFKKKNFIDRIDPTNSHYKNVISKDSPLKPAKPRKGSIMFLQSMSINEELVTVKQNDSSSMSLHVKPFKEKGNYLDRKPSNLGINIRLPSISCGREELANRVNLSLHASPNIKVKMLDDQKARVSLRKSVNILPSIRSRK